MAGVSMVETAGEPAFAVDHQGTVVDWNGFAEDLLGHRRSEVVGRACWEVLQGRDAWGNRYCGATCPLREMARRSEPVRRTRLCLQTAGGGCGLSSTLVEKSSLLC